VADLEAYVGRPAVIRRLGKYLLFAGLAAAFALLGVMAFMRRDHKVELVATYPNSAPAEIWRLLTDHAAEPQWLPAFATVTRRADLGGHEVWTHRSPDGAFNFTVMTVSAIPERRYERLLLRDDQPRSQSWDGRWIYELEPAGSGTRLKITEYGWTDGFPFFIMQRAIADPDAFLKFYANRIGQVLNDPPAIQVLRSH
jgi:uncharacterized protein YndB with AHSA1/START domain